MRRTSIRLAWTPKLRHKLMLVALWCFYRLLNRLGLSVINAPTDETTVTDADLCREELALALADALPDFVGSGDKITVCNLLDSEGRAYTVMIAQVRGPGPILTQETLHV